MRVSTIILGGGPAACAAAICLARSNLKVVVLERTRYDRQRVGEALSPSANVHLRHLGISEIACNTQLPCPGIVSFWGDLRPNENDFILGPHGTGWHLDRRQFDELLAQVADSSGALIFRGARVVSVAQDEHGMWEVNAMCGSSMRSFKAEFLIDATGRSCWLSRHFGARWLCKDNMVGLIGNIALPHGHTVDRRTWLEASESGWWYSAVLPGDRMAIAYMTDSDLLPSRSREIGYYANLQLQRTTATLLRVRDCAQPIDFRVVSAASYQVSRVASRSWVAIGDAAMCWDPLSGQGISKALESGIFAATTRHQVSAGNRSALVEYGNWISDEFQHYRRACVHYYRTETRWPDSPFWRRRQRI